MPWIQGTAIAERLRADLASAVAQTGLAPRLAVLLVGDDAASGLYVRLKEKAAAQAGIRTEVRREPDLTTESAIEIIRGWNADPDVHGILVQLPLPAGIDPDAVIAAIEPAKDVDSFHPENRAALLRGEARFFSPVHLAVLQLAASTPLVINAARALILAKSPVFSEPLAFLLRRAGAFVTVSGTPTPAERSAADLVVTALGTEETLRGETLKPTAVVIDISTTRRPDGRVVGDFAAATLGPEQYASPVPGGVGPLTIAFLLRNVVTAAERQKNIPA